MIARRYAAFALTEWIPSEHDEPKAGHVYAERLKIGTGFGIRPPMANVKQNRGRWCSYIIRYVQMAGNVNVAQCFEDNLLDSIAVALNSTGNARPEGGR